jgi:hypothetical protein
MSAAILRRLRGIGRDLHRRERRRQIDVGLLRCEKAWSAGRGKYAASATEVWSETPANAKLHWPMAGRAK